MQQDSTHRQVTAAVDDGWMRGGSFLGSVLSGFLLGYLGDRWLDTTPWLVIVGIVVGSYSGFMRLWHESRVMTDERDDR